METTYPIDKSMEQSYALVEAQVNPKTGIIPEVRPIPTPYAQGAFFIYLARHPLFARIAQLEALLQNLKTASSAIGKTPREAFQLACFEALERWSTVYQGSEYAERHTYRALRDRAVLPNVLHGISERQYAHRLKTNKALQDAGAFIPERLGWDCAVAWCPTYSLTCETWKYILKSSCYFGWRDAEGIFSAADSRGVAAGPNRVFCVWKAILELIETDAGAIWNGNFLRKPGVDIASFEDAYCETLIRVHEALGRKVWVLDISADIPGVTVLVALSRDCLTGTVIKGFGSDPSAHRALEKALMECCQMLPNVIDDEGRPIRKADPATPATVPIHFVPDPNRRLRTRRYYEGRPRAATIEDLVRALAAQGVEVLVQNVTRPSIKLPVMRVFGVNLRSWFDRRGPGRLYTVPVALGERATPIPEASVNADTIEK